MSAYLVGQPANDILDGDRHCSGGSACLPRSHCFADGLPRQVNSSKQDLRSPAPSRAYEWDEVGPAAAAAAAGVARGC
jgi:hypothetical protein